MTGSPSAFDDEVDVLLLGVMMVELVVVEEVVGV